MPFITDMLTDIEKSKQNSSMNILTQSSQKMLSKSRFRFDIENVMKEIRTKIFGQDKIIQKIKSMLEVVLADITEPNRPLFIALLLGPTGVGKTEIVKTIANAIHGSDDYFSRVDMNTLSQEHYAAALTGAPPGYVGSKEGSSILDKQKVEGTFSKPGIVLFDEIEKASSQVIQSLLNVFDNGKMVMASGEKIIDFRNSLIFMTSNLGSKQIFEFADRNFSNLFRKFLYYLNPKLFGKNSRVIIQKIVMEQLEKNFAPEFINRLDDIYIFNWLNKDTLFQIVDIQIKELNQRLQKHQCHIKLEASAIEYLVEQGFDKHYGARALKRSIRKNLEIPIATFLNHSLHRGEFQHLVVKKRNNQLEITEGN
ncbi:AAA family ATPase [Tepidibacillus sp. HK-1]|uniref:AAA family ATPase n=1 Tax=Tepidibacillus sp. HK-1 TaxID=1883407 RepID=UPI0008538C1C|nr:AAA family ATPase [Tepidibacillus sp. HK-1]GBF10732.1 chaperone protein ClpB 1 [Tepidibacillus sp. HK-1]